MKHFCRFAKKLWQNLSCRLLIVGVAAAAVGAAAGRTFISSVAVVDGQSMTPTFQSGASIYTIPISTPLERGDIVLVDDGNDEYALKRLVGMPGETVHLWRGRVFVNQKMLIEPYLPKHTYTSPNDKAGISVFELGEDQYFVLGDNRPYSVDSRRYGPVERNQIKRRIPPTEGAVRAYFVPYTLPALGEMLIRPL